MKLMLRAKMLGKKITLISTAFVLAVSTLAAAVPFMAVEQVSAAANTSYVATEFDDLSWVADRRYPTGGADVHQASLVVSVDNTASVPVNYEGLKADLPTGKDSVKASLYIDPAWEGKAVRTGLWGVSRDTSNDSAWPLIEYTNDLAGTGYNGIRVWDTNTGDWYAISTPAYGSMVDFEVAVNPYTSTYEFYVNGSLVKAYDTEGYNTLSGIIFNIRNSVTGNASDNYTAIWTNLSLGVTPAPVTNTTTGEGFGTIQQAIDDADTNGGDTISLTKDLVVSAQQTITKEVTIEGNGHTITGNFVKTDTDNNAVIGVQSDGVKINNLVVDGGGVAYNLHGINIYQSTGVKLTNITARNSNSGVNVNGSVVTIDGIATSGNRWNGIDVDKAGAHLTIKGANQHTDSVYAIYVDDENVGQVVDADAQYSIMYNPADSAPVNDNDLAYNLKLATPTLSSPANNGYTTTNSFDFDWEDVASALSYEFQNSKTEVAVGGVLSTIHYSATTVDSKLYSNGAADGTVRYWQVRAVDQFGNKSDWSDIWKMTIDMSAPAAPSIVSPSNNAVLSGGPTLKWNHVNPSDVDHYIYESYADEALTTLIHRSDNLTGLQRTVGGAQNITFWWHVAAVDAAGNVSAFSPAHKLTVDNINPVATITGVTEGAYVGATVNLVGTVSDANPKNTYFEVTGPNGYKITSKHTDGRSTHELTWNTIGLANGNYSIQFEVRDAASNKQQPGVSVAVVNVKIDRTAPVVSFNNVSFFNGLLSADITATDAMSGIQVIGYNLYDSTNTTKIMDLKKENFTSTNLSETSSITGFDLSGVPTGDYVIRAVARDANSRSATELYSISIDNTPPVVSIPSRTTEGNVITPNVTIDGPATFQWALTSGNPAGIAPFNATAQTPSFTALLDGDYVFTLTATDVAGNVTTRTFAFTYTTPVVEPASLQGDAPTQPDTPTITGPFTNITDGSTEIPEADVEGASDARGASDILAQAVDADNTNGEALGLAWYWWIVIAAGAAALVWWIVAMIRGRNAQA